MKDFKGKTQGFIQRAKSTETQEDSLHCCKQSRQELELSCKIAGKVGCFCIASQLLVNVVVEKI